MKRALDIVVASLALAAIAPTLVAIAVCVKVTSRGPVLFACRRLGRDNREFRLWKFRTMYAEADVMKGSAVNVSRAVGEGPMWRLGHDPRMTRVGRVLRRTSLDELPQLWNVLRGEMSLVGPRPPLVRELHHHLGKNRARQDVTPGMTGPHVMAHPSMSLDERAELDDLYAREWSLWKDVKLLVRTVAVALRRRGR